MDDKLYWYLSTTKMKKLKIDEKQITLSQVGKKNVSIYPFSNKNCRKTKESRVTKISGQGWKRTFFEKFRTKVEKFIYFYYN